jgi:putative ATP-dependent endonuclease of OLD family
MYISEITIKNFRCFDETGVNFKLNKGLTALVGENDSGKTAIIDAIRYALGTTDQNWNRIEESDFYNDDPTREIQITLKFEDLNQREQAAFLEYLTYIENDGEWDCELYINYSASTKKTTGREYTQTTLRSGKNCDGPELETLAKILLNSTYLQPLRDAERSLSSGRNSRLSQILKNIEGINTGNEEYATVEELKTLSISAILELADELLSQNSGIQTAKANIDKVLEEKLLLTNSNLSSTVNVTSENLSEDRKLTAMLEKLNLGIQSSRKAYGKLGLGTNNILYIACELLLMNQNEEAYKLLLIEEPEAHIHVQRQMKIIKSLQNESEHKEVVPIFSTVFRLK